MGVRVSLREHCGVCVCVLMGWSCAVVRLSNLFRRAVVDGIRLPWLLHHCCKADLSVLDVVHCSAGQHSSTESIVPGVTHLSAQCM
jgi:hypothetical protein